MRKIYLRVLSAQHLSPLSLVGYMLFEGYFDEARLLPGHYVENWQCLYCTLINPAGWQVFLPCDADLDAGRIGNIDNMGLHAEILCKTGVTAGAGVEVAAFRADDAEVALGQFLETGVAITLAIALFRRPTALDALDLAGEVERDASPDMFIQRDCLVIEAKEVLDGIIWIAASLRYFACHFSEKATHRGSLARDASLDALPLSRTGYKQ